MLTRCSLICLSSASCAVVTRELVMKFPCKYIIAAALFGAASQSGQAEGVFESLDFTGTFENRTAVAFSGNLQKSEFVFLPEVSIDLSAKSRVTIIGRLRGDVKDRLEPGPPADCSRSGFSGRLTLGSGIDTEIREAYLDTEIAGAYVRLGKQQIVWGQADGLKVLDVLNPQSFREFILDDFEDSRIPLWSLNAEIPISDYTLQLIWIPDTTYNDTPDRGAEYAFTSPLIVPTTTVDVPISFVALDKPSRGIEDSDIGVKLSAFLGGWDLSLNYAYHYQDNPVTRRNLSIAGVLIVQSYERSHLAGGTFSNVFGDFTLRGELGYSTNKYFQSKDVEFNGVVHSDEFSYVLGVDYAGFSDWFLSAQIFQSILTNGPEKLVRSATESNFTLLVQRDFMNEALKAEALLIQSLTAGDGVLQLSLIYEWRSDIRLKAGADIFYGKKAGLFGQYHDNDRMTFGIEVSF